jgi:hypothetical protein
MNKIMLAFVAVLSIASFGCKKKGGSGDALAKMEGFSKAMCECKDKACADKVQEDMTKWGTEAAKTANKDEKPDPEMVKKSGEIMTKYTECMTKLMMAGTEAPKPPEPAPAGEGSAAAPAGEGSAAAPAGSAAEPPKEEPKK